MRNEMNEMIRSNHGAIVRQSLLRRKLLIFVVLVLVVAGGMAATFLITPKYEATMSILVSRDRIDPQISSSDKLNDITQTSISDEEFNSELELFKSNEVVKGVVKELDLINDQAPKRGTWLSETRQKVKAALFDRGKKNADGSGPVSDGDNNFALELAVNRVVDHLDVVPIKKSRVIKITYSDTDPIRAKATLEAIYRKFVEMHVSLNEKPEAAQVFNEQTGKFNQKLESATNTLKQFDATNGISGADITTQQGLLLKQLSDTDALVNATRTEIGETIKKIASLKEKVAAEPVQIQTGYVSKYVQALDRMKEELSQLEQQRTQLLQKYQPNSRFVRDNQERIDQIKRSIASETANPPQERSFAINELRRKLEAELYDAQTSLAALKDREKTLTAQSAKLNSEVALLNTRSIERTGLERQRAVNEEAYLLYQKKARENEIGQVLNREQIMNFAVVDPPRTDGEQKNPKPLLNLFVLLGVGMLTAFAAAFLIDRMSGRRYDDDIIRSAYQLERRYDLPVLASIPHMEIPETASSGALRRPLLTAGAERAHDTEY